MLGSRALSARAKSRTVTVLPSPALEREMPSLVRTAVATRLIMSRDCGACATPAAIAAYTGENGSIAAPSPTPTGTEAQSGAAVGALG